MDAGKPAEALAVFDQILKADPNYVKAWLGRGFALYDLNRFKESATAFQGHPTTTQSSYCLDRSGQCPG